MDFSIFKKEKERKTMNDRHRLIHYVWKTRLFVPFTLILQRWIKKFIVRKLEDIPNEKYNVNFRILWFSVEKGIEDWYYNFYRGYINGVKDPVKYKELEENWKGRFNCHWYKIPMLFLGLYMTVVLEDTAYREQLNCILNRLQGEMNRRWKPGVKHKFPLYMSMYDSFVPFFIEWMRITGGGKVALEVNPEPNEPVLADDDGLIFINREVSEKINNMPLTQRKNFMNQLERFILRIL